MDEKFKNKTNNMPVFEIEYSYTTMEYMRIAANTEAEALRKFSENRVGYDNLEIENVEEVSNG